MKKGSFLYYIVEAFKSLSGKPNPKEEKSKAKIRMAKATDEYFHEQCNVTRKMLIEQ